MADTVTMEVRSRMMSGIRGKDTKPELLVRRMLHSNGFRFRLHRKDLPGHPDIVLRKFTAVIFVHGCFWHGHDCHHFRIPSTRTEWWGAKIDMNRERDTRNIRSLREAGWRVLVIWECAMRRGDTALRQEISREIMVWVQSRNQYLELRGDP